MERVRGELPRGACHGGPKEERRERRRLLRVPLRVEVLEKVGARDRRTRGIQPQGRSWSRGNRLGRSRIEDTEVDAAVGDDVQHGGPVPIIEAAEACLRPELAGRGGVLVGLRRPQTPPRNALRSSSSNLQPGAHFQDFTLLTYNQTKRYGGFRAEGNARGSWPIGPPSGECSPGFQHTYGRERPPSALARPCGGESNGNID